MSFLTVLLAEDEPCISLDIKQVLEAQGFRVILATELQEVVDACRQHSPDFILLNFFWQHQDDGMLLARILRRLCPAPIKFITGACPEDVMASPGFDMRCDILYKPFSPIQLRRWVEAWGV